ncbi:MAG: fructosamine kinase family protein [Acidiferrobacterales bacterium]
MPFLSKLGREISTATGRPFVVHEQRSVGGGCINSAFVLIGDGQRYFVKLNRASKADMFAAEFAGLQEIARANAIRVPTPICCGTDDDYAYLVLNYIERGSGNAQSMEQFGHDLAQMHRFTRNRYGWDRDNTIGATPQLNTPSDDWVEFWQHRRLGFQLELAARNRGGANLQRKGEQLLGRMGTFFHDYAPAPSLLHGDLWSGNYTIDTQGRAVIFDPAVYYGDRETDLAMTELFGGFSGRFYAAYCDAFPLQPSYAVRKTLYNLYHVLNHFNLFGGGYASQAEHMIDALVSEIR